MKVATRAEIRHYVINLLKDNVDVGKKVYANRPNPIFLDEVPCICVYFENEDTDLIAGDRYHVKEYQRNAMLVICIVVDDIRIPGEEVNKTNRGEDYLDYLETQVEQAMFYDWRLARRLPDFDPNTNMEGLTHGSRLTSVTPYEVDTESERRMLAQDIRFLLPYNTHGYINKKYKTFSEYYSAIVRVGSDKDTVDRVLLAAQGEIENGNN